MKAIAIIEGDGSSHNRHAALFFLALHRPPISTLFPSRRSSDLRLVGRVLLLERRGGGHPGRQRARCLRNHRSEEHTSELQSRRDLVCRLLLEKKNSRRSLPTRR